jgi:predicted nucleotidyltransferase component of viral defense system
MVVTMVDINRHKFFLLQLLKEIYSDPELASILGFKGGTALMFFYDLPRFSVDLDLDLLDPDKAGIVYHKIRDIVLKYGSIFDEAKKHFGVLVVLDYGRGERKLKIEISGRQFNSRYEIKDLLGFSVKVMVLPDMFAHKLCALTDRKIPIHRDIFDTWFFLQRRTPVNKAIVETRMKMSFGEYLERCIDLLKSLKGRHLLDGLGELTDPAMKIFVKTKLLQETIRLLRMFKEYPLFDGEKR